MSAPGPFQAGGNLRGYPALPLEDETEETLAAAPAEKTEKKSKHAPDGTPAER